MYLCCMEYIIDDFDLVTDDDYNPYCSVCGACGEEGCCQPTMCKQSPDGDYCDRYLRDLHFGYRMHKRMELLLEAMGYDFNSPEYNEIFDSCYKLVYEQDNK